MRCTAISHPSGPVGIPWETFASLAKPGLQHAFSLRSAVSREALDAALPSFLGDAGFAPDRFVEGEQPHGNRVACVEQPSATRVPAVDGLVTATPGLALVVRVADCGPVFFYDPVQRAIGLAHSGRKGTEGNITAETLATMAQSFGSRAQDVQVLLGPCIRPPHYEVPFAATILDQASQAGAVDVTDSGACTASALSRYYSYRLEKGKTGRHWAVLMLSAPPSEA